MSASTRVKVEAAAKELGYVASSAASSLASGRNRNIGVVVPFLDGWFYMRVLKGAHDALSDAGYDLTLYHLDQSATESGIAQQPSQGAPVRRVPSPAKGGRLHRRLARIERCRTRAASHHRKPAIGIGGPLPGALTLSIDDTAVARLATEHLLALGHREIAHIGGDPLLDLDFHLPANRRVGYEAALATHGLTADPLLVRVADFTIAGGYRRPSNSWAIRELRPPRFLRPLTRWRWARSWRPGTWARRSQTTFDHRHRWPRARRVLRAHHRLPVS